MPKKTYKAFERDSDGEYRKVPDVSLSFDLLDAPDILEGLLTPLITRQADRLVEELRLLFCAEAGLHNSELPATWDQMDAMFQEWVIALLCAHAAHVPSEMKKQWEDLDL